MSNVAIEKAESGTEAAMVMREASTVADRIRDRAFHLFLDHGGANGFDLGHWFQAEKELMQVPEAHLIDKPDSFQIHIAVPGFAERDVKITALRNALIVSAEAKHKHSHEDAGSHSCSFGEKRMFRRFELPAPINTDKVHARLENGLLKVTAHKLESSVSTAVAVSAA
jgi:HSP20 family molecular chaperone IbpA